MDLSWACSTAQALLLLSVQSSPGQDSAPRADGLGVPWRLPAVFPTEGHWQKCFSYCSFIFFSSIFVLFISLRQLCEFFFFVLLCCWLTFPPSNLHCGISSFSLQASQVVQGGRAAAR